MGLGGFGGLDLKNIKDMIPEGTFDLIKNMKPEDIKNAVANMPPYMVEMMKGMGKSLEIVGHWKTFRLEIQMKYMYVKEYNILLVLRCRVELFPF